ncbi:hypothetical protein PUN28_005242 [Cardiocondyla obscurior]|uniref:Uncharacterized protein n=1 Tax=Cardiocondyla obscurior TaxID=286306 RepID=A0AAW2GHZ2_9HYME
MGYQDLEGSFHANMFETAYDFQRCFNSATFYDLTLHLQYLELHLADIEENSVALYELCCAVAKKNAQKVEEKHNVYSYRSGSYGTAGKLKLTFVKSGSTF